MGARGLSVMSTKMGAPTIAPFTMRTQVRYWRAASLYCEAQDKLQLKALFHIRHLTATAFIFRGREC